MSPVDEEVIVISPPGAGEADGPDDGPAVAAGVEVVVEGESAPDELQAALDDLDDVEPMPATQRAVLVCVAIIVVAGIALLVAYWNGLLG